MEVIKKIFLKQKVSSASLSDSKKSLSFSKLYHKAVAATVSE